MTQEALAPIKDRQAYSTLMAQKIEYELYQLVYRPILEIFGLLKPQDAPGRTNAKERRNAQANLTEAVRSGSVAFLEGYFRGRFSAAVSREILSYGGRFDKRMKAWKVNPIKLPVPVTQAIAQARETARDRMEQAFKALDKVQAEGIQTLNVSQVTEAIYEDLHRQFRGTTAERLQVPMAMEGFIGDQLKTKYTESLQLEIKNWSEEATVRLRKKIQQNSLEGYRAERMEQTIRSEYGVSVNKARFLARQETSLLVSKYREENYKEAGINEYRWSTSVDRRVRPDHRALHGKTFRWDSPPVVDRATGRTGHPGEDFGCRCVAIPLLPKKLEG